MAQLWGHATHIIVYASGFMQHKIYKYMCDVPKAEVLPELLMGL